MGPDVTPKSDAAHILPGEGEERVLQLLDSITDAFCALDAEWRLVYLNGAAKRIFAPFFGEDATALLGRSHWDLFPASCGTIVEREYRRAVAERVTVEFEVFYEPWKRWFATRAYPIDSGGLCIYFRDVTDRKRFSEALLASEQKYRALFDSIDTGFCVFEMLWDADGAARDYRFLEVNPAFERHTGLRNPVGRTARELVPDLEPHWFQTYGRVARTGEATRFVQGSAPMGRWFDVYAFPIGSGPERQVALLFTDITERREADERHRFLVQLDDAVRPLADPAEITTTAARLLGEHLRADRCAYADVEADEDTFNLMGDYCRGVPSIVGRYKMSQFGVEALARMRANEPYVVEDVEMHQPPIEDLTAYRATCIRSVVSVPLHKAGRFVAGMAIHQKFPRRWTQSEVELTQLVANRCWEALQRAQIARTLRESEERFRTLADNVAQLAWMADEKGWIFWYNRRWFDYTGTTLEEMQGWGWQEVHHPDYIDPVTAKWSRHLEAGQAWEDTFPLRGANGEYRWFLSRAVPVRSEEGKVVRWFGTNTDVTEQRAAAEALARAKEEAETASRAKDDFLAALSHELRTPLTPVLMAAEDLCNDPAVPAEMHETLCMMRRNIVLEARLIDDLLDLTRIARGKLALRQQPCEVHSLIADALEIVREEAQEKGLALEEHLSADRAWINGDPARLQQVFWNLLKNAVKFTPAGGRISVRSWNEQNVLLIEVSDTGIGIVPDAVDRIFLPFEQAGLANDHRFGGLGLGLSISRVVAVMHGGNITARSAGPNQGATFRVELPGAEQNQSRIGNGSADLSPEASAIQSPEEAPQEKLRLLLVEDHEATLTVLSRLLTREGHTVLTADSVAAAWELARRESIDAVISDIGLPDGSGVELMRGLHELYGLSGIALSGYGMEEDLRRSHDVGFVAHLVKPVEFIQLLGALAQLVKKER